jgi:hypothetical protein
MAETKVSGKAALGRVAGGDLVELASDESGNLQTEVLASVHITETEYIPVDDDATNKISSFMDAFGNYFFMKETLSGAVTSLRYWKPSALDYTTDWAARTGKSYDLPSIF